MYIKVLTFAGFTLATICASICPMGMTDMSHANMQMTAHEMPNEQEKKMPCDNCEQHEAETAAMIIPASDGHMLSKLTLGINLLPPVYTEKIYKNQPQLPLANGPPLPTTSLIGTVILRT